jgi:DNA-directed RNA polymerase specialized sigma24 family protein
MKAFNTATAAAVQHSKSRAHEYATASEFCQIFSKNMEALYTLALALTADKATAEHCLLMALEECKKTATVFRQWAHSWSRLAVIESAIRLVRPSANDVAEQPSEAMDEVIEKSQSAAVHVSKLRAFDRFTFVLSVLDRYSVRDCAILLKCRPQEVKKARQRAIEFIAKAGNYVVAPTQPVLGTRLTA